MVALAQIPMKIDVRSKDIGNLNGNIIGYARTVSMAGCSLTLKTPWFFSIRNCSLPPGE